MLEIQKANIKKQTRNYLFCSGSFIALIVGFIAFKAYTYYQNTKFDFKETEKGINFYSKDMPIKEALQVTLILIKLQYPQI